MRIFVCYIMNRAIGLMNRVFSNGPGDRDLIPGRVIPKTQKIVLDTALLNTQHYKVRVNIKKEAFGSPSTKVANFTYIMK